MLGEVLRKVSPDYFLANPPRQPKKEIGDYVESQGILVPRRFASLSKALESGKPFIARAEHLQDYAGVSNLFLSPEFDLYALEESKKPDPQGYCVFGTDENKRFISDVLTPLRHMTQDQFEDVVKRFTIDHTTGVSMYCKFMGIPLEAFLGDTSYSYWELLGGRNRTIVADSAIPGRYHIMTSATSDGGYGYTIVENGNIVKDSSWRLPPDLYTSIPSFIDTYEAVRRLPRFDRNHCPIMEVQTVGETHYFLQYHRAADSSPSSFALERQPEEEFEASFVRGATPKDGLILRFILHTSFDVRDPLVREEEAGLDFTWNYTFREIMTRKRVLNVLSEDSINDISRGIAAKPHLGASELFKSPLCLALEKKDRESFIQGFVGSYEEPIDQFNVHVISDGRRAYIKRLD